MKRKITIGLVCIFLIISILSSIVTGESDGDSTKTYMSDNSTVKKWTFMFYDDADFYHAFDPLDSFAKQAYSGENLSVIVLQDKEHDPAKMWYIDENHNKNLLQEMGEINMGNYETLKDFIEFCKNNFSADRYIISFYDHGMGWEGACSDDTSNDQLTMDEMQKALTETGGVDIVCFSAPCIMGALESIYELRDCTDVYIGSEEYSGYGWWMDIMGPLCDELNQYTDKSNIELGDLIIHLIDSNSYNQSFTRENMTMSAIRTDKMNDLGNAIDTLSLDIINNFNNSYDLIRSIYKEVQPFHSGRILDIYDLAEKYLNVETNQTIIHDLEYVLENLTESIIAESHGSNKSGAHGLSINFPNPLHPIYNTTYGDFEYGLDFANDTHWNELLKKIWLKKSRGIAVGADVVGDESSISDILTFVEQCNINLLIVDFGWITWSWNNTRCDEVNNLINESIQKDIPIWLMYRARTLSNEYEYLQHQVNIDGEVDDRYICFTDHECRNWSINWAHELLEKYPNVDGIILYNPQVLSDCCYCPKCLEKFRSETGIEENPIEFDIDTPQYKIWLNWRIEAITDFINEWKNNISLFYPDLKFGLILNHGDTAYNAGQNISALGEKFDLICPFAVLHSVTNADLAGDICNEVKEITNATVVADIKIYGPYNNSAIDIINAITSSLESNGDGFFIWNFDSLDPSEYDVESIKRAYNPYHYGWYIYDGGIPNEKFSEIMIIVFEFLFAAVFIAVIFYLERKRK